MMDANGTWNINVNWMDLTPAQQADLRERVLALRMERHARIYVEDSTLVHTIVLWASRNDIADRLGYSWQEAEALDVALLSIEEAGAIAANHLAEAYRP